MDFQGGLIVLIIFVSLFAIWLIFYFIPVGLWFSALVSGVRISLLQLILGVDNVQYATSVGMAIAIILLDYIIAYTVIGLSSMFGSSRPAIIGGVVVTLGLRFLCHFLTGWMIWDALWPNEFGMTSAVYSLWYNGSYMLPEGIMTTIAVVLLYKAAPQLFSANN